MTRSTLTTHFPLDAASFPLPGPRWVTALMAMLLVACTTTACGTAGREPPRQYTSAQQRMLARFGDRGYELKVDAMKGQEFKGVNFYEVGLPWPIYGKATQTLRNETRMSRNGPIPEQVRIVWRKSSRGGSGPNNYDDYVDDIIGDEIVEVGPRIPQALIDDLKRDPKGSLRLKFRMSEQGTLLGWDIERRPGMHTAAARQARAQGKDLYYPPAHSHSGGDFKEARPAYYAWDGHGFKELPRTLPDPLSEADQALLQQHELILRDASRRLWEKGWYIDKRTGQKIETNY